MTLICGNTGAPVGNNCEDCMVNCRSYREWKSMNKSEQMAFRGTITKLPRDLDPNVIIKNEMQNKYGKCPFCGNEKSIDSFMFHINGGDEVARMGHEERYGRQHKRRFWEEKHHWRIDHWHCYKCGASWNSEEYPMDI